MLEIEGNYNGGSLRIGIVLGTFNGVITDGLLAGAEVALQECSVANVTVMRLPGALELVDGG